MLVSLRTTFTRGAKDSATATVPSLDASSATTTSQSVKVCASTERSASARYASELCAGVITLTRVIASRPAGTGLFVVSESNGESTAAADYHREAVLYPALVDGPTNLATQDFWEDDYYTRGIE